MRVCEREVKKKQRIKRDRMLTNIMSLFLEGRLFVWRFLIWDLSLSLSLKEEKEKNSLSPKTLFFEREREWPSRSKSPPFLQSGDDLSFLQRCCKNTHFFVCWIIIVIILSSCFGLSGESLGLWIFHDVEFSLNDSIHAGFLRGELIRGCGSEVKLIFYFLSKLIYGFILLDDFINWVLLYFNYAFWNC